MATNITYDGKKDYTSIFQSALDNGGQICIGSGFYTVCGTLRIHSDTHIIAQEDTVIFTADNSKSQRGDFLFCNADPEKGNCNITVEGGTYDGNCRANARGKLFGGGYTGTMFNFFNVRGLTIKNVELRNPECYYVRLCRVSDFQINHVFFNSDCIRPNQDGIHLAGFCSNGKISDLKGSYGSPNDDFVALNADDCLTRLQNLDVLCGEICNIEISNLYSPLCHSFVRILSVNSKVSNIRIKGLKGSCKAFALNMDAGRYCKPGTRTVSPFQKAYYTGVGDIRDVQISDVDVCSVKKQKALILAESNVDNLSITNFTARNDKTKTKALSAGYIVPTVVQYDDGKTHIVKKPLFGRVKLSSGKYNRIVLRKY